MVPFCLPGRLEGVRGFYKGVSAYLVHVTPNICIVFLLYEYVTQQARQSAATKAAKCPEKALWSREVTLTLSSHVPVCK